MATRLERAQVAAARARKKADQAKEAAKSADARARKAERDQETGALVWLGGWFMSRTVKRQGKWPARHDHRPRRGTS